MEFELESTPARTFGRLGLARLKQPAPRALAGAAQSVEFVR